MGGGALCLGCNLHEKTPAPRRREEYAGSTRSAFMPAPLAREVSYRKRYRAMVRGFFWESPPVRAEEGAGSACPAGQPGRLNLHLCAAPWAAGGSLWEAIPFYSAGLLSGSDAPQARIGCGFNPAGSARIYAPPYGGGRFPMGSNTFYGAGLLLENLRPSGQRGVGMWLVRKPCVGLCGGQFYRKRPCYSA